MMKQIFFVLMLSLMIGACGSRPETATIATHTPPKDSKKETTSAGKVATQVVPSEDAKPAIKLPGQFVCDAKDSIWYNTSKIIKAKFAADLTTHPQFQIKSDDKDLTFKVGREFVEGEKIDKTLDSECEDKIEHTDQKYEWTYTCRYFVKDADGSRKPVADQSSYFRVHANGMGKLCRILDQQGSLCWDLSECK
jgi:uncharacterized protein YceK